MPARFKLFGLRSTGENFLGAMLYVAGIIVVSGDAIIAMIWRHRSVSSSWPCEEYFLAVPSRTMLHLPALSFIRHMRGDLE